MSDEEIATRASKFRITGGKGFNMAFESGYSISVQFGAANYCDNQSMGFEPSVPVSLYEVNTESTTAEIAIFRPEAAGGGFLRIAPHDDVLGHQSTDEVAAWIQRAVVGDAAFPQELEWQVQADIEREGREAYWAAEEAKENEDKTQASAMEYFISKKTLTISWN
jgi:hypothetical protein